jgi:hypothetical protein
MQQVLQSTKDNIMYCMISIKDSDRPEILKIQGVTWFETQELAYQYYMFLKPELREEYVYPVEEQDLPSFENITPEDVKVAKYKTRLISNTPEPGVTVYNNGE